MILIQAIPKVLWSGSHECTTTLTIEDVDGNKHTVQQLGDSIFPHPFGYDE